MTNKQSMERLKTIARANKATISFSEASDSTYVDCEIVKGDIKLYVILTRFGERYYAYDLTSDIAPSELYMDLKTDEPEALRKRETEIFNNVGLLLRKDLVYHKTPSFLNKQRGYVELQVDGELVRLRQRSNLLKLPEA